jgi:hypothetical protein
LVKDMAEINYSNIDSLIGGFNKIMQLQNTNVPSVPSPIIIAGGARKPGLSPSKIANAIIQRKSEAGLPVGTLPSGSVNPEEIMWRIAIEEIIKALQTEAMITVAIPAGTTVQVSGANSGGPMVSVGSTLTITTGYAQIQ